MEGAEAGRIEGNGILDVFGDFAGVVEVTLLSPAHRGAGYETTQTTEHEPGKTSDHRCLQVMLIIQFQQ